MNPTRVHILVRSIGLMLMAGSAWAGVTADEAAKLKTTLTPLGAERAGNKEGSIPAWTGGVAKGPAGAPNSLPADPYAKDKPEFQITAANMAQYAGKLSEGAQALLKKYPSFHIDVYPTRRSAAVPQYVQDNTFRNATKGELVGNGESVKGVYGGIPFPIPKSGIEVYWNHTLHYRVPSTEFGMKNIIGSADGRRTLGTAADNNNQAPYYYPDGSAEKWQGDYLLARFTNKAPTFKVGEALVIRDTVNAPETRAAWQYLVGQRRVRRAPTVAYDTPDFVASGANYFDEVIGFYGAPDRYEWKLVGKKEMYIPYNNNRFFNTPEDEAFVPHHPDPAKTRWELHRVWVVEASLAPGKRHAVPKRRFYFDEDTWAVSMVDGYDAEGKLWRTNFVFPYTVPEVPALVSDPVFVFNLQAGTFSCVQCINGGYWRSVGIKPDRFFTGDALASDGVR
ncbi:MAG: DUF1329 domain-containing protein [Zoogloea sp.]|nr:DUF1329 domain-containing protein [Zoogloea sp.]